MRDQFRIPEFQIMFFFNLLNASGTKKIIILFSLKYNWIFDLFS